MKIFKIFFLKHFDVDITTSANQLNKKELEDKLGSKQNVYRFLTNLILRELDVESQSKFLQLLKQLESHGLYILKTHLLEALGGAAREYSIYRRYRHTEDKN